MLEICIHGIYTTQHMHIGELITQTCTNYRSRGVHVGIVIKLCTHYCKDEGENLISKVLGIQYI